MRIGGEVREEVRRREVGALGKNGVGGDGVCWAKYMAPSESEAHQDTRTAIFVQIRRSYERQKVGDGCWSGDT